jgi:hypothetical protein
MCICLWNKTKQNNELLRFIVLPRFHRDCSLTVTSPIFPTLRNHELYQNKSYPLNIFHSFKCLHIENLKATWSLSSIFLTHIKHLSNDYFYSYKLLMLFLAHDTVAKLCNSVAICILKIKHVFTVWLRCTTFC